MTMNDPIADMLTRIRNAIQVGKKEVLIPASKIKSSIALVLKDEGYVQSVQVVSGDDNQSRIQIELKYDRDGCSAIQELKRISTPGCRVYAGMKNVPVVRGGLGLSILTTPMGVMSGRKAFEKSVGGEVLCTVF